MDAYLSGEALLFLKATSLISNQASGFLIGHKRGHRFFVESIFPFAKMNTISLEKLIQLNQLLEDRIIGFFSFYTEKNQIQKILTPYAVGRLFLKLKTQKDAGIDIKPYFIEYEKEIQLVPIRLKSN